jgi:N6-adenosine-specific RNA methylase IME4
MKRARVRISDHAVLRYLERVGGFSIEELRRELSQRVSASYVPGVGTITIEAAAREHSRKPDEAFRAAEELMPEVRRLELFSREKRRGWTSWGNEVEKFEESHEPP